tara:strand:- start:380 stop:2185 length:1806 start_codon:yes stop_codon:yes gene_type:complete
MNQKYLFPFIVFLIILVTLPILSASSKLPDDSGLRVVSLLGIYPLGLDITDNSQLKFHNLQPSNLALVDTNDKSASPIRIMTSSGIKSVKKTGKVDYVSLYKENLLFFSDFEVDSTASLCEFNPITDLGPYKLVGIGEGFERNGQVFGYSGDAVSFDGINDHINFGDVHTFSGKSRFTVAFWANPLTVNGLQTVISQYGSQDENKRSFSIQLSNGLPLAYFSENGNDGSDGTFSSNGNPIPTSSWTHIILTLDLNAKVGNIFVNGISQTIKLAERGNGIPNKIYDASSSFLIGAQEDNGVKNPFNGAIDDLIILDRFLDEEAATLFYNRAKVNRNPVEDVPTEIPNTVFDSFLDNSLKILFMFDDPCPPSEGYTVKNLLNSRYPLSLQCGNNCPKLDSNYGFHKGSINFDGNQVVKLSAPLTPGINGIGYSVSMWVRYNSLQDYGTLYRTRYGSNSNNNVYMGLHGIHKGVHIADATTMKFLIGSGISNRKTILDSKVVPNPQHWSNYIFVYDAPNGYAGSTMRMYIDGEKLAEAPLTQPGGMWNFHGIISAPYTLGSGYGSLDGSIDLIMAWDRPLNEIETKILYSYNYDTLTRWLETLS